MNPTDPTAVQPAAPAADQGMGVPSAGTPAPAADQGMGVPSAGTPAPAADQGMGTPPMGEDTNTVGVPPVAPTV